MGRQSSVGFAAGAADTGRAMPGAAPPAADLTGLGEGGAQKLPLLATGKRVFGALHRTLEMGAAFDGRSSCG